MHNSFNYLPLLIPEESFAQYSDIYQTTMNCVAVQCMYGSYCPSVLKYICQYKIDFVMYS